MQIRNPTFDPGKARTIAISTTAAFADTAAADSVNIAASDVAADPGIADSTAGASLRLNGHQRALGHGLPCHLRTFFA